MEQIAKDVRDRIFWINLWQFQHVAAEQYKATIHLVAVQHRPTSYNQISTIQPHHFNIRSLEVKA